MIGIFAFLLIHYGNNLGRIEASDIYSGSVIIKNEANIGQTLFTYDYLG